jgi:UDP:flavonoid glycosyltransferase YjiC (YdhE family)
VVAGVHEGKNEICARVGYFKLGINLKTETPSPRQIKLAVEKILSDNRYKINVEKLEKEFTEYDPFELSSQYIAAVLKTAKTAAAVLKMEMV